MFLFLLFPSGWVAVLSRCTCKCIFLFVPNHARTTGIVLTIPSFHPSSITNFTACYNLYAYFFILFIFIFILIFIYFLLCFQSYFLFLFQYFLLPLLLGRMILPCILSNTLYALAMVWYAYITHLGYRGKYVRVFEGFT